MAPLRLPKERRAHDLFARFEERCAAYLAGLPSPLAEAATSEHVYLGRPGDGRFRGMWTVNPGLVSTPWLFWETFGGLDDERFLGIAEAGAFLGLASLVLDNMIDGQVDQPAVASLLQHAFHDHGAGLLRKALPDHASFWAQYDQYAADHLVALALEIEGHRDPRRLDWARFRAIAHGKASPMIATVAALAAATGQPAVLPVIETSLDRAALAILLLDDVGDWKDDLAVGHMTHFISSLVPPEAWDGPAWPAARELQAAIDADWADVENLRLVMQILDRSADGVQGLGCSGWLAYIDDYRELTGQHLTSSTARHLGRVMRQLAESPQLTPSKGTKSLEPNRVLGAN